MKIIEVLSDDEWRHIQEKTGTDIMTIVMDVVKGRVSAGDTMDRIAVHCEAAYQEGVAVVARLHENKEPDDNPNQ